LKVPGSETFNLQLATIRMEVPMKTLRNVLLIGLPVLLIFLLAGCDSLPGDLFASQSGDALLASGVVEATEVVIAPEVSGTVAEVRVQEGDSVAAGDVLFTLKDDLLQAQYDQAQAAHEAALASVETARAALELAQASLEAAQAGVDAAQAQYDLQLAAVREADAPAREDIWNQDTPAEFNLPGWYFDASEQLQAAHAELDAARADYEVELTNFNELLDDPANTDLRAAEERLSEARAAFEIAQTLRDRAIKQAEGKEPLDDYIQTLYDAAKSELESAQLDYDQLLTEQKYKDVLEARARVSAAKQRYEIALDYLNSLQTGENDLSLKVAEAAIVQAQAVLAQAQAGQVQAEAAVTQAEKAVEQTQAALEMAQIQLDKLTVRAPVSGVVLTRNVEVGELVRPGGAALTIGLLDNLTVKVYIPESEYGQIRLGDTATLTTNSFPDETFEAVVIRISEKAEYTPRNVQTSEDRATTVYAVDLSVTDPQGKLKPGMPVDVQFGK
jgi:multidrug resistance efflux pump